MKKIIAVTIVFLCANILVLADTNIDVKVNRQFENGTILSSPIGTYKGHNFDVCTSPYDPFLLGVYYNVNPKWNPSNPTRSFTIPIVIEGITYVKVNNENGKIHIGDPITSSTTPGVGMKATESGIILGIALEDSDNEGGLLKIRVIIQYLR